MLTPEAKKLLAETIRGTAQSPEKGLRGRLLRAIHDEADRRYRLSVSIAQAGLDEAHKKRRQRIEAWVDERARATKPKNKAEHKATAERLLAQAEKEAAATLINRLVLLRHLEALGLSKPLVVTGGWSSRGYREFRAFAPTLCTNGTTDATEGYATLLQLVFDELAVDLPGLFGDVGLTRLFPVPAATLREVIERLDEPALASAWTDDTTLGWVYQYWNDPDREALDAKINGGGKIEPHEIASKTQMFTERYMVEWLLQNSLGLTWLAMCKKHGWTPDADRVLGPLDARRAEWRRKREAGEVALDALMPIEGELEEHWKYYVPQPIPDDAVEKAPASVRAIKLLDPACGSGHFLVIAFGLLVALYREEARHKGTTITDKQIAESILENNLFGIDIDPRAIQIAAAGLYLKAKALAKGAHPRRLNLVAPVLQLGNLPADDPALVHLLDELKAGTGIPRDLTSKLVTSLSGVDYLGSLFRVDLTIEETIRAYEEDVNAGRAQGDLFRGFPLRFPAKLGGAGRARFHRSLDLFLQKHSGSEDLGLRLGGEQLAAGVRFLRIAREGTYDLVVGNPPYQGTSKTTAFGYVAANYPRGKADLYAAFLERGLQLVRPGGISALLTMRGWMFLGQFAELRKGLLREADLRALGDVDRGAFEDVPDEVLATVMAVLRRAPPSAASVGVQPTPPDDRSRDGGRTNRKRAALLAQVGRHDFNPRGFEVIEGEPIVYWWGAPLLMEYSRSKKMSEVADVRFGVRTSNNARFVRRPWEVERTKYEARQFGTHAVDRTKRFAPLVMGGAGRAWVEPLCHLILWANGGLEVSVTLERAYGAYPQSTEFYFRPAVALPKIGATPKGRIIRFQSVVDNAAPSIFSLSPRIALCSVNRTISGKILSSLNPTVNLQPGDILRLPVFEDERCDAICDQLLSSFVEEESTRETSVEFVRPGRSAWNYAKAWAQDCVDRPDAAPLPLFEATYVNPSWECEFSFEFGCLLGRFEATRHRLTECADLLNGLLFVGPADISPALWEGADERLGAVWRNGKRDGELSTYLRKSFFDYHKKVYENRPIYFPLSSAKRSFVAFVSIHRWTDTTLNDLLADHLVPTKRRLDGELDDLRSARATGANKGKAEKRFTEVQKLLEELNDFIDKVTEIAEKGPLSVDDKTTEREVDARYTMDLDDGVMVNSAALWPLLDPQWKDPKKWWKELANAQGKKDYDWSHLAARYFPTRVKKKCHEDPSLAVAHKCFWELHPAKAYAWELRLQDEIRHDFTIDEPGSDAARAKFLAEHAAEAAEIVAKEAKRRAKKSAKAEEEDEGEGPLFNQEEESDD